ncbi:hypothetical protein CHUAL_009571 [Chamberlinius hualienensis]
MYIASTKPNGFTLDVINPDSSMVMTGVRIMVGGQDIQRAPSYIEIFNRSIQVTLARSRWDKFPFTKEESLQADKKISILFGPSTHSSGVTIVDTVKVYGKTKESFGWPEETDELSTVSPSTVYPSTNNFSGDFRNVAQVSSQLTSVDRIMVTADVMDAIMKNDDKKQSLRGEAVELATSKVHKQLYHIHKDQALVAYAISNLSDMSNSQSQEVLDNESFYNILCSMRAVAVGRPYNLMHFADTFEKCSVSDSSDKRLSTRTTSSDPAKHKITISDIIKNPIDLDVEGASGVTAGIDFGAKESASQESVEQEQSCLQLNLDITWK